jgi:hypothetical protein
LLLGVFNDRWAFLIVAGHFQIIDGRLIIARVFLMIAG